MQYVRLGATGLAVSRICLGSLTFGTPAWRPWILDEAAARPVFRRAVELGINFFDTADTYSGGESEVVTGRLLAEMFPGARREEAVVATKVYNPVDIAFDGVEHASCRRRPTADGLSRKRILLSEFSSVCLSLLIAYWVGVGVPLLFYSPDATGFALLFTGTALTIVFTAIAFLAAVRSKDKARGIGIALLLWFYFSLIYDALILLILFAFSDYPMEKFTLLLSALNPVDLARIFIMLKLDISALMGYTGALYKDFFGSGTGLLFTAGILFLWASGPLWLALRSFERKDM